MSRLHRLHHLDLRMFRAVERAESPVLDATLPKLTRAANHSKLWLAIAAGLALSNDRKLRAAGVRGATALGLTSLLVNVPLKRMLRRDRPDVANLPLVRKLRAYPASSSFPSGHAASAAAFAAAVAREHPAAGSGIGVLAAAVGASRIYTGAHYPSDVLAGAALGVAIGAGARRLWHASEVAEVEPETPIEGGEPHIDGRDLVVAVNPKAGPAFNGDCTDTLREKLPEAVVDPSEDIEATLRSADAKALGVAGGDGTVGAAAAIALERGMPLAIVPRGTLNHAARDLGIESIDDAVKAINDGTTVSMDVGLIDGRLFLNTASFGAYPELVDEREKLEGSIGKWPAAMVALARVLARSRPVRVTINGRRRAVWAIFVGNCGYVPRGFAPSARARVDDGTFDVRILRAGRPWSRARAVVSGLRGDLSRTPVYEEMRADRIVVRSHDGPLRLAADGETFDGSDEFVIEKAPERLRVFVPRRERKA